MRRSNAAPLLVLYVGYLLIATFHPFILSDNSSELSARLLSEVFTFKRPGTKDFAQNVILFIPFGALFYFCLKSAQGSGSVAVISTLAAGCAVSLAIEAGQIFVARHPSLSDVVANSLGSVCGALISTSFPFRVRMALGRFWETLTTSKGFLFCILMFGAAPLILSTVQSPWPNFRTWDSSLPLQIANEATLDRPWLGRIYLVAVYNRALSEAEITNNFNSGFSGAATARRAKNGLVALYTFAERGGGVAHDVSGFGDPLNLSIVPKTHVNWLSSSNGIEVTQPAILRSYGSATKLANAFRGADQISIEAWFAPANLSQAGPARLVSFSGDPRRHNFTLGQEGSDVTFRLRTLISGGTGRAADLSTNEGLLTLDVVHLVSTYAGGVERFYVNGVQHPSVLDVTKDVIVGFATRKTPIAQTAYSFFYFFPVVLFLSILLAQRRNGRGTSLLLAALIGAGMATVTEFFQAFAFERTVDFPLIGYSLIVSTVGALTGAGLQVEVNQQREAGCLSQQA